MFWQAAEPRRKPNLVNRLVCPDPEVMGQQHALCYAADMVASQNTTPRPMTSTTQDETGDLEDLPLSTVGRGLSIGSQCSSDSSTFCFSLALDKNAEEVVCDSKRDCLQEARMARALVDFF